MERLLKKRDVVRLLQEVGSSYKVVVPVQKGNVAEYVYFHELDDPEASGLLAFSSKVPLPAKPLKEAVLDNFVGELWKDPLVFFGIKPCDAYSTKLTLDTFRMFNPGLGRGRKLKDALFFPMNCTSARDSCFCDLFHAEIRNFLSGWADATFTDLGDSLFVDVKSVRAYSFFDSFNRFFGTPTPRHVAGKLRLGNDVLGKPVPCRPIGDPSAGAAEKSPLEDLETVLELVETDPEWVALARRCRDCGECAEACPTCTCNYERTQVGMLGEYSVRKVAPSACKSRSQAIAGPAFPATPTGRPFHRVECKFKDVKVFCGVAGCSGCGRCVDACPEKDGLSLPNLLRRLLAPTSRSQPF
ncbi:MAG: hypothetical protein Kow0069_16490 [Promethearchaeota archaeon]